MFVARGDGSIRTALKKYTTIGLAQIVHFVWLLINPGCSPTTRPQALTRPTRDGVITHGQRGTNRPPRGGGYELWVKGPDLGIMGKVSYGSWT